MKKKKSISILVVMALCIAVIAMNSYAFWSVTATQSGTNVVGSGCFDLSFTEGDAINLDSQFPIIDADSETLSPYTFTITNTCNIYASYQVNLEVLPVQGTETKLNDQYVKVSLNNSNKRILTEHEEVSTTIIGAITSYKLTTGELAENESVTYDLREWLEENTPLSQVSTSFRSKIVVIAVPTPEPVFLAEETFNFPADLWDLSAEEDLALRTSSFWGGLIGRDTVETISFTTTNEVPAGVIGSWDAGEEKNGKVIAWYTDADANSKYEIVVGANGGVYAPVNSSGLFIYFMNLNSLSLTNLDTSRVTDMFGMFFVTGVSSTVFTLELGDKFDTSKVTNMSYMFTETGRNSTVFTLDLGDRFDTSDVTNMGDMFANTGYNSTVFTLDLGDKFDTSKVTDMNRMFFRTGFSNLNFTLDLGDRFDTSSVTNMGDMFHGTGYNSTVFTLDLCDKFDTSKVTSMNSMFNGIGGSNSYFTLDLGDRFDTSSVTNMEAMFYGTGYNSTLFTLDLGDKFDTSNVTNMGLMFTDTGYSNVNFTLDLRNFNFDAVTITYYAVFATGNASHKFYASESNIDFISAIYNGITGTVINCTTSPASCP